MTRYDGTRFGWTKCPHCGERVWKTSGYGPYPMLVPSPGDLSGRTHSSTCPQRVRIARIVDRPDPIQKLIPAAAKMREPITVRAKR